MSKKRSCRFRLVLIIIYCGFASATAQTGSWRGQASGWLMTNPDQSLFSQSGLRYIPEWIVSANLDSNLTADVDLSINSYGSAGFRRNRRPDFQGKCKPYRAWIRLSTNRFEVRLGLQKINFGSATLFRPLMWFDRVDPRDPLQLTDGVYAILSRYYFLDNANIWLWGLYGNNETKGWEFAPTSKKSSEYGGRVQIPVSSGELGASYHHRQVDFSRISSLSGILDEPRVPEERYALDGKWDVGIGTWFEAVLIHARSEFSDLKYQRQWVVGLDNTFAIGNGLSALAEFFRSETPLSPWGAGPGFGFSGLSLSYPLGLLDRLSCIIYRDWTDREWYRLFTWQRSYDNWTFYLLGFWNPQNIRLYQAQGNSNPFSGTGMQILVVFNH